MPGLEIVVRRHVFDQYRRRSRDYDVGIVRSVNVYKV